MALKQRSGIAGIGFWRGIIDCESLQDLDHIRVDRQMIILARGQKIVLQQAYLDLRIIIRYELCPPAISTSSLSMVATLGVPQPVVRSQPGVAL